MNRRLQKFAMGILLSVFAIAQVQAQNTEALVQTYDLEVTFEVNLAVQQELGVYDPTIHTPGIASSFTGWASTELTTQIDTSFSEAFLFNDVYADTSFDYKFVLIDGSGNVTWEDDGNRSYIVTGTETDSNGDTVADTTVSRFFNDVGYDVLGGSEGEDYDITFNVNLSTMEDYGLFNPAEHAVKVVGSFNNWDTAEGIVLNEVDNNKYQTTVRLSDVVAPANIQYKFILDNGEVLWEEPFIESPDNINNRSLNINGDEVDSNSDGVADIDVGDVDFSDLGASFINSIASSIATPDGDSISFIGTVTRAYENFLFVQYDTAGIYSFNSSGFIYDAIQNGDILPGHLIEVSADAGSFEGLKSFENIDYLRVVHQNIGLPEPVTLTAEEYNNSGDRYNSELVKLEGLRIAGAVDFIGSTQYEVIEDATADTVTMFVRGDNGSALRGPIPSIFDYVGVAGYFGPNSPPNQLTPTNLEDIISQEPELPIPAPPYEFGDIINYNGSFALNNLGPVSGSNQGWLFETVNGPSVYEIVNDSQDDDGKAARVIVQYDGSVDVWRSQVVNEPIFPAEGDLYKVSMWLKSTVDGFASEAFLGLPGEGNFEEVNTHFFELGTEWEFYSFNYFATGVDADLGLRLGLKLNFESNDGDTLYIDNVQMEKIEAVYTPVTFSVNVAVQEALGNFDKGEHIVGLVGSFNGWDAGAPIVLEAELSDSVYTGTAEILNASIDDEIRYKFILKDDTTGVFQWEAPDPENPDTDGDFSDRIAFIDDVAGMEVPTVYFHDIDRSDLNIDNYDITPIIDARNSAYGTHLAVQGIVTRITNNFVYVQDETAATTLFSRPFFSSSNSVNFNLATKSGEIQVGDELKIAGITADFNGLHEVINIHAWDVVSAGNPLPNPQLVDINEYSNNGEEYESEVVRVERVRILDPVDSLKAGFIYEIVNEEETQIGWISIQSEFNSDWAFQPAPQGFFNIEAVVKEYFIPSLEGNIYAVSIHDESDIEIIHPNFDAEFSMISFAALPNTFETLNIDLIDLGNEPIQGMEFTINFDPNLVDINLGDQTNTLLEGTTIITNKLEGQLIVAFASDGTPENDISDTGVLFNMGIDILATGKTEIVVSDISINEMPSPELYSFVNIVPRLCGDVTGDVTISTEDATLVLQHTVKLEGIFPLVELDSTAADVTGNGDISAFDASWILQKTVGLRDQLGCITLPLKEDQKPVSANWLLAESNSNESVVQLDVSQNEMDIYAIQMELDISAGASFTSIRNLPDGWNIISNTTDDGTFLSLYGVKPFEGKTLDIEFNTANAQAVPKLKANIILNERSVPEMDELVIGEVPSEFSLHQNYPNPFNPSTNIGYTLAEKVDVELSIYNMLGQKVATVVNQTQEAGSYSINWQAGNLSSGVYIYRLTTGDKSFTKRMMLIK